MVAGGWMGLAVKTDGAAVASGAIADSLDPGQGPGRRTAIHYEEGWMLMTATTVKMFIDVFIGIWAFMLAVIWCTQHRAQAGREGASAVEIWQRFPKFVLGYVVTFVAPAGRLPAVAGHASQAKAADRRDATSSAALLRDDVLHDRAWCRTSSKLWEEGIGKLAAVYVVCLFGFIIWIGLADLVALLPRRQAAPGRLVAKGACYGRKFPNCPPEEAPVVAPPMEAKLIDELQKMEYEPLLPVEKKLIVWSIGIGVVSLGFLYWLSVAFFPGAH